jgi:hypothetical protein
MYNSRDLPRALLEIALQRFLFKAEALDANLRRAFHRTLGKGN